jgi:hypothetical protein
MKNLFPVEKCLLRKWIRGFDINFSFKNKNCWTLWMLILGSLKEMWRKFRILKLFVER